jgi:signal transduction histidine kinase
MMRTTNQLEGPRDSLEKRAELALQKLEDAALTALEKVENSSTVALVKLNETALTHVSSHDKKKAAREARQKVSEAAIVATQLLEKSADFAYQKVTEDAMTRNAERTATDALNEAAKAAHQVVQKAAEVACRVVQKAAAVARQAMQESAGSANKRVHSSLKAMSHAQIKTAGLQSRLQLAEVNRLQEAELLKSEVQFRQMVETYAGRLIILEEGLREKIAMDLHDDIAQVLTAVGLNLTYIGKHLKSRQEDHLGSVLEESRMLVKEVNRSVRDLAVELHPLQLDEYGLVAAIRSHVAQFVKRTHIYVAVDADPNLPKLAAREEAAFYRITQEALHNVLKHAAATKVNIFLGRAENGLVRLTITDDGKGFVTQDASLLPAGSGWGLKNMRHRMELIGGSFRVHSLLGQGTTINADVREIAH